VFRDESQVGLALATVIAIIMPLAFVLYQRARAGYRELIAMRESADQPA
jgi:hypothetical protein